MDDPLGPAALHPARAGLGNESGTRREERGDVGLGHRLTMSATDGRRIVLEPAWNLARLPTEARRTQPQHLGRERRRDAFRQLRDAQPAFVLLVVRQQIDLFVEVLDAVFATPTIEYGGRRAVVESAVDLATAADHATFDVLDTRAAEGQRQTAVAILLLHLAAAERRRAVEGKVRTVLEHGHRASGLCEVIRGDGAAGPGADHDTLFRVGDRGHDVRWIHGDSIPARTKNASDS